MRKKLITLTIFGTLLFASISAFSLKEKVSKVEAAIDITDYTACNYAYTNNNANGLLSALRNITSPGHAGSYDASNNKKLINTIRHTKRYKNVEVGFCHMIDDVENKTQ